MRISLLELICNLPIEDRRDLKTAEYLSTDYWLNGVPNEVIESDTVKTFESFVKSINRQEKIQIYALLSSTITAIRY